jgi:hypothetical protein
VGLLLAVGVAVISLARRAHGEKLLPALAVVAVAATLVLGFVRARSYADYEGLALEAAERQPTSAMARLCAGNLLRDDCFQHVRALARFPAGTAEWRQEAETACQLATASLQHYDAASRCTNIDAFVNSFALRTYAAEVLAGLGRYDEAREKIGPLPPPGMSMLSKGDDGRQWDGAGWKVIPGRYPPQTLAGAWLIFGEASLRQCAAPGLSPDQKLAQAAQALQEAEESLKCHTLDHEAHVLAARAMLLMSNQYAAKKDMAAARKLHDQAIARLKEVPESSLSAANARRLLTLPPPTADGR